MLNLPTYLTIYNVEYHLITILKQKLCISYVVKQRWWWWGWGEGDNDSDDA